MRGDDVVRIIKLLELWNLPSYLRAAAAAGKKGRRIQALTLLTYLKDEASLHTLLQQSRETDVYIQLVALRGLALQGPSQLMQQVIDSLTQSGQTNTLMLSDILQHFGQAGVPDILRLVQSDANPEIRIAGIMALGTLQSLHATDVLIKLTQDRNIDIRAHAIAALGKIGDERAADAIVTHLTANDAATRTQAAQALGHLQKQSTMPQLMARLADDNWWVRFRAAEALYRFGDNGIAVLRAMAIQGGKPGLIARQVLEECGGSA